MVFTAAIDGRPMLVKDIVCSISLRLINILLSNFSIAIARLSVTKKPRFVSGALSYVDFGLKTNVHAYMPRKK